MFMFPLKVAILGCATFSDRPEDNIFQILFIEIYHIISSYPHILLAIYRIDMVDIIVSPKVCQNGLQSHFILLFYPDDTF